ncbi:MAG TPA: GNAT family N-acetyltransferase [Pyrinomonadaceae bacterium]|nr:GNAT family N-acetyltransferase [Pyrinomonadaceae bacterium]
MPNIKPLKKLVTKAREVRDHHKERHTPSGFGFALADRIDFLDHAHWDKVTAHDSLFLSRRYLRVLEDAGPENLRPCYALIFREREPVAAIAAQIVTVPLERLHKKPTSRLKQVGAAQIDRHEEKMLVAGNILSWGMHGISFAPNENHESLWPAVAEAVYRLRRVDKLFGDTAFVMVKDIPDAYATSAKALSHFSYRELETEPNMVLDISPRWKSYDDYLASLNSKYRKQSKQIDKEVVAAGCVVEEMKTEEIARHADELHALYLQTHHNAAVRLVTLPVAFLPTLGQRLGDDMRFTILRKADTILGFVTTVKDGDTAVGYYIGFDRTANAEVPIYFRLLQSVIGHAIALGCNRLSLGRTALEPKARLGAHPEPLRIWIRHRIQPLNVIVRGLLRAVSDHEEPPARNPFK